MRKLFELQYPHIVKMHDGFYRPEKVPFFIIIFCAHKLPALRFFSISTFYSILYLILRFTKEEGNFRLSGQLKAENIPVQSGRPVQLFKTKLISSDVFLEKLSARV